MLRAGESHGYHIIEMLDKHAGTSIDLKKPTAYRLLEEMLREGWLSSHEEKDGKRPAKRIFSLTPEGEKQFTNLLRLCISQYKPPEFQDDIALMFCEALPPEEVVALLEKRLSTMNETREALSKSIVEHAGSSILDHQMKHIELDIDYIKALVKTITNKGIKHHG
jgi:DNA-binding PadR family transcriptional regulator